MELVLGAARGGASEPADSEPNVPLSRHSRRASAARVLSWSMQRSAV